MPERPTIAYLTSYYARASDTFIRGEVEQLRRLGHVVHTFSIRKPDPSELVGEEVLREHAQTVFLLDAGPIPLALAGLRAAMTAPGKFLEAVRTVIRTVPPGIPMRWVRRVCYLLEAAYLAECLRARGVCHLHNHIGESSAVVALLAARFRGIPYSLTIHGPGEFDRPTPLALGEKIRGAAFVAAISEFTRSQLYRWSAPEDWSKIHVVHCGLDAAEWLAVAAPVPSRPRLVSVGRLCEQKGQWLLVEAAARLRARGLDFELVLVGGGPLRAGLERRVEQLGLHEQVRITGYLTSEGVRRELLAARALVLPSFAEGLPVVIMEALALHRPVISTFIGGTPELVEPGVTGWLVPAGAVGPLVDAMAEALTADPAELERMGRAGAARVARDHNAATEARKLADLIAGRGPLEPQPDRSAALPGAMAAH